jgi:hypothetical protein
MVLQYVLICVVSLLVAGLTLFSGFGLGTLLMPAFALFFPVDVAVAATAVVHLANNLFKVGLVGRRADGSVVLRFAIPGMIAAVGGAALLEWFAVMEPLAAYRLGERTHEVTVLKLVMSVLILAFGVFELIPAARKLSFSRKWLPVGGALSGFFGGLSGHQGALRSAFLINAGLRKEVFIGTGAVASTLVDLARLAVYLFTFTQTSRYRAARQLDGWLIAAACAAAFIGAFAGARLMKKVTLATIRTIVGVMLVFVALTLATGLT